MDNDDFLQVEYSKRLLEELLEILERRMYILKLSLKGKWKIYDRHKHEENRILQSILKD